MKLFLKLLIVAAVLLWAAGASFAQDMRLKGIVYPIDDVELSMPVDGVLMTLEIEEGDRVKKGRRLLRLDDRLPRLETRRRKMIWQDASQVRTMEKNVALLRELVKTKQDLHERTQTVSRSELKNAQMQLNRMTGEYDALKANEAKEKIEYDIARETLSSYSLESPIDGRVVEIFPAVGEWVRTGKPVVRIVNTAVCYLDIDVDLATARRLQEKADDIRLKIPTGDEELEKRGRIQFVSAIADTGSSLVRMKIHFDNQDGAVVPGVTAYIEN